MPLHETILECIGNTPAVRLRRITEEGSADVYVKVECCNPSGSIKARPALAMIEDAEKRGVLKPDSIIVEPTSGNQGIALAMIGAVKGYRVRIVLPESASVERRKILEAYGAELVLTPVGKNIKETFETVLNTALEMRDRDPRVFVPQQFENPRNPAAHEDGTAAEIVRDFGPDLHAFVAGIGTGGTISGVGRVLKAKIPGIQVVAVEPSGAPLLTGGEMTSHIQEGIGDGLWPGVLDTSVIDRVELVTDEQACETAKRLAREEGIFCGLSTGTTVTGALRIARELGKGKRVLAIMADGGEKYLSTRLCEQNPEEC
ncbi:MAG: cysteine synthase A [Bacillota bacterium]|nr:cysteine synthase A [Bacillota bacterium]